MKQVSNAYKKAMNEIIREQAFISIVLAEVNGIAQNEAKIVTDGAYWSDSGTPFNTNEQSPEYATFEEDFVKADGKMLIMPRENTEPINSVGFCTPGLLGAVTIDFGAAYAIKGLTIDFGDAYPTEFVITTSANQVGRTYQLDAPLFETTDTFGDISSLTITPTTMVGGQQRLRIKRILMGIGLSYNNEVVANAELTEEISSISESIPSTSFSVKVLDKDNIYNVNNTDSFIGYLTTGQIVTVSFGVALDEDATEIEWLKTQTLFLSDWSAKEGEFTFSATNLFAIETDKYTLGNRIYTRTAYAEAESILQDWGLEPGDYFIDEYLKDITLTNPMPEDTHANCLLLLCNATRCIYYQDKDGVVFIQGNFALNIEPENINLVVTGEAAYSTPRNILTKGEVITHYADFTKDFVSADGTMEILPRNPNDYVDTTGFISSEVADENGNFVNNPTIQLELEAGFTYYGLYLNFTGQPPQEVVIRTYHNGEQVGTFTFADLENENVLSAEFLSFDTMNLEFTKGGENARVVVDYIGLGNITDYLLDKDNMTSYLLGTKEEQIKDVNVKIYTYILDENDNPQEVDDDVWHTETLNTTGRHIEVSNPLIGSEAQARSIAEWLGIYYINNYSYEVDYRGDPRLNAADIIKLEDEYINNLQVSIDSAKLTFNGAFSGQLQMRRAMRE